MFKKTGSQYQSGTVGKYGNYNGSRKFYSFSQKHLRFIKNFKNKTSQKNPNAACVP